MSILAAEFPSDKVFQWIYPGHRSFIPIVVVESTLREVSPYDAVLVAPESSIQAVTSISTRIYISKSLTSAIAFKQSKYCGTCQKFMILQRIMEFEDPQ